MVGNTGRHILTAICGLAGSIAKEKVDHRASSPWWCWQQYVTRSSLVKGSHAVTAMPTFG